MSFLGKVASGIKIVAGSPVTNAVLSIAAPQVSAVYNAIVGAHSMIEAQYAQQGIEKAGPAKHTYVVDDFNRGLQMANEGLRRKGKQLVYSGDKLDKVIKLQTDVMNAISELTDSFDVRDI